jgi:uncharacterized repeat protein (TIGR01451 family)
MWHDLNANGVQDNGEVSIPGDAVMIAPLGLVSTMPDGTWGTVCDTGTYVISPQPWSPYVSNVSPSGAIVPITTATPVDSSSSFAYRLTPDITDVRVDMVCNNAAVNAHTYANVILRNMGTEPVSGTVSVGLDPLIVFTSATPNAAGVNGQTVHWTFTDLGPGEVRHFQLLGQLVANAAMGATIINSAHVATTTTDQDLLNNTATTQTIVLASYDPNDKTVVPPSGNAEEIANGASLVYTIRFQNTGTYHASRVVITDTLSPLLDLHSMRFLSASHTCSWSLLNNVLVFRFEPIFLPDSGADEIGSHGYVRFLLNTVPDLQPGAEIANVANIYFDLNEPVITAPAVFEVVESTSILEPESDPGIVIIPNPVHDRLFLSLIGSWSNNLMISVTDLAGKRTVHRSSNLGRYTIDISGHASGLLIVDVTDGTHRQVMRVAKY